MRNKLKKVLYSVGALVVVGSPIIYAISSKIGCNSWFLGYQPNTPKALR